MMGRYAGVEIVETTTAVEKLEDWSKCRSRARAERRLKRGFPQRVETTYKPACFEIAGRIFIHPVLHKELMRQVGTEIQNGFERDFMNTLMGRRF